MGMRFSKDSKDQLSKDKSRFLLNEEEVDDLDDTWRHTYKQEQDLMEAIKSGRTDDAVRQTRLMDKDSGRLSQNELEHWKRLTIIGISLSTRAAIEGGLPPKDAYRISGYYISKTDNYKNPEDLLEMRDMAIRDLTSNVEARLSQKKYSIYTKQCMDYIEKNYRTKIYLDDIADTLGISPSYLSKLFKSESGKNIQDYLVEVRIERAANLLKYSDEPLPLIAQYVNFPSQSYFGKVFKKYMGVSPKVYRDQNKTANWQS